MAAASNTINMKFVWQGPNTWSNGSLRVRVVDLVFKGAKNDYSVHLPQNIHHDKPQQLPITRRKYLDLGGDCEFKQLENERQLEILKVKIEQIRNLTISAGFFEPGRPIGPKTMDPATGKITQQETVQRNDRKVELELPEELEMGQTYNLVVTSDDLALSARLVKVGSANFAAEEKKETSGNELQERMKKMGEALIAEGLKNMDLASRREGVFNSSSTPADVHAHLMQGVIRSGQAMHPGIRVPDSKPSESSSDFDKLSVEELQSRFKRAFILDKKFEAQRMKASMAGQVEEANRIAQAEHANSQILINLAQSLEKKGIRPQIPQM